MERRAQTSEQHIAIPRSTAVRELLAHPALAAGFELRAGEAGLSRPITHPRVQKSGLILAGHAQGVVGTRVQILGETEVSFLESIDSARRGAGVEALFRVGLSCVVVTRGIDPLVDLVVGAGSTDTPLVVSEHRSSRAIHHIHAALDELLAPSDAVHGVLVEIHGVGVLLLGPSGIGKSECALFLVERGHRLVADDRVVLTLTPDERVDGAPPELLRHHLEVRGLGILNIRDLFGATAVRERVTVDLVVELCQWRDGEEYDRLGIDDRFHTLLGVAVPLLRIPVSPGRDMGVLLEVAARNALLKRAGRHSARRFTAELAAGLGHAAPLPKK